MRETMHPNAETVMSFLQQEGYVPTVDQDGDIRFKCEGRTLYVFTDDVDVGFYRIIMPNIWMIESEAERQAGAIACSEVTGSIKAAKTFLHDDDTFVTLEAFYPSADAFCEVFGRSLSTVQTAARRYAELMRDWAQGHQNDDASATQPLIRLDGDRFN